MSHDEVKVSSDLIRWLKLLTLPGSVKAVVGTIMVVAAILIVVALGAGVYRGDGEMVGSMAALILVGLPTSLLVLALLFGDSGEAKLRALTRKLLEDEVPRSLMELGIQQLHAPEVHGCIADYRLGATHAERELGIRLEVNVRKVNLVVWMPGAHPPATARDHFLSTPGLKSCLLGAEREGYQLNEAPKAVHARRIWGCVFIKALDEDFLLSPAQRLYFTQDLAFFLRGLIEATE